MSRFEIPSDKYGRPLYNISPRATTLARTVQALGSSFWVEFDSETTFIRVHAKAKDVYLKWAINDEDYVDATDFDEMIQADTYQDFIVPLRVDEASSNGVASQEFN